MIVFATILSLDGGASAKPNCPSVDPITLGIA